MTNDNLLKRMHELETELIPAIKREISHIERREYGSDNHVTKIIKYKNYRVEYYRLEEEHKRRNQFNVWAGSLHD